MANGNQSMRGNFVYGSTNNYMRTPQSPVRHNSRMLVNNHGTRSIKGANNRGYAGKTHKTKDNKAKIFLRNTLIGLITAGALVGGAIGINKIRENSFINNECAPIVTAIEENYDNSEYLQESMTEEAYMEYATNQLKDAVKCGNVKEFISENKFDGATLAYLLTGEADRSEITDQEILDLLAQFLPYAEENEHEVDGGIELGDIISDAALISAECTSDKNKSSVVALVDGVVGSESISNSQEALKHKIEENEYAIEAIENNTVAQMRDKISINNNFHELGNKMQHKSDANMYLKPYVEFRNSRVEFAQNCPEELKEVLGKFLGLETWDQVPSRLSSNNLDGIADGNAYEKYRELKNESYKKIIDYMEDPVNSISGLKAENEVIQGRIDVQNRIEEIDLSKYLNELYETLQQSKEANKNLAEAEKTAEQLEDKLGRYGFGDEGR